MNSYFYYFGFVFLIISVHEIIEHIRRGYSHSKLDEIQGDGDSVKEAIGSHRAGEVAPEKVVGSAMNFLKKWGIEVILAYSQIAWWIIGMIWSEQRVLFAVTFLGSFAFGLIVNKFVKNKLLRFWIDLFHSLIGLGLFIFVIYNHFYPTI